MGLGTICQENKFRSKNKRTKKSLGTRSNLWLYWSQVSRTAQKAARILLSSPFGGSSTATNELGSEPVFVLALEGVLDLCDHLHASKLSRMGGDTRSGNPTEQNVIRNIPESKPSHTLTVSMHVTHTQSSDSLNSVAVLVLSIHQATRCALLGTILNPDRHGEFSTHPLGNDQESYDHSDPRVKY